MADDGTASQRLHGITENVPADALDDVFHELWSVAFQLFPFLGGSNAFIGDGFPAEAVLAYPGLYVRKSPPAGQFDEQHPALAKKANVIHPDGDSLFDGGLHRPIYLPPEIYDVGIG